MYALLIAVVLSVVNMVGTSKNTNVIEAGYSEVLRLIQNDGIEDVILSGNTLLARKKGSEIPKRDFGNRYDIIAKITTSTQFYADVNSIYAQKLGKPAAEVGPTDYAFGIDVKDPAGPPWWQEMLLPMLMLFGMVAIFWYFTARTQGGGKNGVMNFGKSRARLNDPSASKVTFEDVAGADEEKEELVEIVEFLKSPARFTDVGARIPKGVLLVGPPGTGKTLLARAVSGESGVPFFTISGSDFVEMFVGVGASRVRDLFDQAKKAAPAIVFIDEIDAVGRQRGAGLGGGHDEREQTLNQLLVEMDGFAHNEGVIVMAATNRSDILDPALLRPGRFDRQITVNYPDVKGREAIFHVHARNKPIGDDVDFSILAKRTPYFTGADIENVLNEGAILTARRNEKVINMKTLEEAITKVSAGPEKKSHEVTQRDKKLVAYHEAGHAIVMHHIPECDNVHEISVIPRSKGMGGYTMYLPDEEISYITSAKLTASICGLMGGRCAERLVFDDISTGASSDIKRATKIARDMVTEYGMSQKLGPIYLGNGHEVFLGRDFSQSKQSFSEEVGKEVDYEVRALLDGCYDRATDILNANRAQLDALAGALIEKEKLDRKEFLEAIGEAEAANDSAQEEMNDATSVDVEPGNL